MGQKNTKSWAYMGPAAVAGHHDMEDEAQVNFATNIKSGATMNKYRSESAR